MKVLKGGEFSISGMTIRNVIWLAWHLPPERVVGGPKWLDSDFYDFRAKPPSGAPSSMEAQYQRLQMLLSERLQLKVHRETKASPIYLLTLAKTGPKMREAKANDPLADGSGSILNWSLFVNSLARLVGRPIVDKTGLTGAWHIKLSYTNDDGTPGGIGIGPIDRIQTGAAGPSIFTAVQEQLGLKLESAKGPVDTLIIDSVSRPSPN